MAAPRELIVILLDVGSTMSNHENSTELVESCVKGISRLIEKKLFYYPKDQVGFILFGTNETDNQLAKSVEGFYKHIKVLRPIMHPDIELLKMMNDIRPESGNSDFIDALIVGIDLLTSFPKKSGPQPNLRLFLVTDAAGVVNASDLDQIVSKMNELNISLNVVGVDFADSEETEIDDKNDVETKSSIIKPDIDQSSTSTHIKTESWSQSSGSTTNMVDGTQQESQKPKVSRKLSSFTSESQPKQILSRKRKNENVLLDMCSRVRGAIVPVHEALDLMSYFDSRSVAPHPNYRGFLEISPDLQIPVWCYLKTQEANMPKLSSVSKLSLEIKSPSKNIEETKNPEMMDIDQLNSRNNVKTQRTFHAADNPDDEVPEEQLMKAYKYGKTFVPVKNSVPPFQSSPCLKIIGFTPSQSVPRHFYTSNTEVIVPLAKDDAAAVSVSALCHAMAITGMVGIARMVKRKNSCPILAVLSPHISDDTEYFYMNRLPFNDDLRMYGFNSLVPTESTPIIPKFATPNERQLDAAEDLINSLDLSNAALNAFGEPTEALKPKYTFNPTLQYFYQVILSKAMKPNLPIPPMDPSIVQHVSPDESLVRKAAASINRFKEAFQLTKTENKEKESKKRFWSEAFNDENDDAAKLESYLNNDDAKKSKKKDDAPFGGGNLQSLLRGGVEEIGNLTLVEDFKSMMSRRDVDLVDKAISELITQIKLIVNASVKNSHYDKAIECILALREGCIKEQEAEQFNTFLKDVKVSLKGSPSRDDFWQLVKEKKINLITSEESEDSTITNDEAKEFYESEMINVGQESLSEEPTKSTKASNGEEAEDLFDLL